MAVSCGQFSPSRSFRTISSNSWTSAIERRRRSSIGFRDAVLRGIARRNRDTAAATLREFSALSSMVSANRPQCWEPRWEAAARWRPQSAISNRRTALGATGSEAPVLSTYIKCFSLVAMCPTESLRNRQHLSPVSDSSCTEGWSRRTA